MKIINIRRNDFDDIFHRLTEYLHANISTDECMNNALHYINEKNILSEPYELDTPFLGEGNLLIHRYAHNYNACRSIYVSHDKKKLFYEGVISIRYVDELKYFDYMTLDSEDIKTLCKKYYLEPIKNKETNLFTHEDMSNFARFVWFKNYQNYEKGICHYFDEWYNLKNISNENPNK